LFFTVCRAAEPGVKGLVCADRHGECLFASGTGPRGASGPLRALVEHAACLPVEGALTVTVETEGGRIVVGGGEEATVAAYHGN
jgi:hypothetical protein